MWDHSFECGFEFEIELKGRQDTFSVEVLSGHYTEQYTKDDPDEPGHYAPISGPALYTFRIFAYNELVQNYEIDITDQLTEEENLYLTKEIDEEYSSLGGE